MRPKVSETQRNILLASIPTAYALLMQASVVLDNMSSRTTGLSGLINDIADGLYSFGAIVAWPTLPVLTLLPKGLGLYNCDYICLVTPAGILATSTLFSFAIWIALDWYTKNLHSRDASEGKE